jgi:hypothetical protein
MLDRNSTVSGLQLGALHSGAQRIKSLVYDTEVAVSELLGLGQRSIRLLDASSYRERDIGLFSSRHSEGKVLVSQLGNEAALVVPMSWGARVSGLDRRNWVIDLDKNISACSYWKMPIR